MKRVILRVMMLVAMASAAVTMSVHTSSKEVKAAERGDAVVEYAKSFVGNRYRYGGSSLTKGTDCSGFTDRKSTRLNSSHVKRPRMPSSA